MNLAHKPISAGLLFLFCLVHFPSIASADGGTVRLSEIAGGYRITLFTSPNPLRVGLVDFSVLIQSADSASIIPDAEVTITLWPRDRPNEAITLAGSAAAATNKLLQAALFELPEPGWWDLAILIDGAKGHADARCELEVAEPWPPWLNLAPWVAWPSLPILIFGIHVSLVRRRSQQLALAAKRQQQK